MEKTLLYRIFKLGKIPKRYAPTLQDEGVILLEEGISITITLKNVKAPGRRHSWKRSWFTGSIAITKQTFAAFTIFRPLIYLPLSRENLAKLNCTLEGRNVLTVRFDASTFNEKWSGEIECKFKTSKAPLFLEKLQSYTA